MRPRRKAGSTGSAITGADLDALLVALGDPTAGELTALYNVGVAGGGASMSPKRALHRHDYVVKKELPAVGWTGECHRLSILRH